MNFSVMTPSPSSFRKPGSTIHPKLYGVPNPIVSNYAHFIRSNMLLNAQPISNCTNCNK